MPPVQGLPVAQDQRVPADPRHPVANITDLATGEVLLAQGVDGKPADIGGYYKVDSEKENAVMRPSPTFNAAIAAVA